MGAASVMKAAFGYDNLDGQQRPRMMLTLLPSGRVLEFAMFGSGRGSWGIPPVIVFQMTEEMGVRGEMDMHLCFEGHQRADGVLDVSVTVA